MLKIEAIAAFNDNYIWCLNDGINAWVVDPGDSAPVIQFLAAKFLNLQGILVTHHHRDHTGGLAALQAKYPECTIVAPANDKISPITTTVHDNDHIKVFGYAFKIIAVPGHTLDHIAFYCEQFNGAPVLFCGDTLFSGGCGRIFEGTAPQMFASLMRLNQLPPETQMYCAHEYTLANLNFAQSLEPDNAVLIQHLDYVRMLRSDGTITLPTTLGLEQQINPFLRCHEPSIAAAVNDSDINSPELIFAKVRYQKDNF